MNAIRGVTEEAMEVNQIRYRDVVGGSEKGSDGIYDDLSDEEGDDNQGLDPTSQIAGKSFG